MCRVEGRERKLTIAREKKLFQALTFCFGVIGKGSYFWLMSGMTPIDLFATFENNVKEVIETEDKSAVS
jgi:hypothetical protein